MIFRRLARLLLRIAPVPPPASGWDARQAAVIGAAPEARLLVDGGPGTGKTAVACARVAHLVATGVPPSAIWVVSFTRTAVREVRDRLAAAIGSADLAAHLRVSTLDSLAWALEPSPEPDGSYDEAIARVLARVLAGGAILGRLTALRHVMVDEAHDIVGARADLVAALIERLPGTCGVTAFADAAQAIYGFTEGESAAEPLVERLRAAPGFTGAKLEVLFRSQSPGLARLFRHTRAHVLDPAIAPQRLLAKVRRDIEVLADDAAGRLEPTALAGRSDILVLFRRRAEVLDASARLHAAGVAHRLRLSGLPAGPAGWIAAVLAEAGAAFGRDQFLAAWHRTVADTPLATLEAEEAWDRLLRATRAKGGMVEAARLRRALSATQPPAELCAAEPGWGGPMLGTIHASKGREADCVHLMLAPPAQRGGFDEEARVLFVGATRARRRLLVGRAEGGPAQALDGGRLWRAEERHGGRANVELGRDGDIGAEGLAGRRYFAEAAAVREAQARLLALAGQPAPLIARRLAADGGYGLVTADDPAPLAFLSHTVTTDLDTVSRLLTFRPGAGPYALPEEIRGLYLLGLATLAPSPDGDLYSPWSDGVPLLTPVLIGFSPVDFRPLRLLRPTSRA